MAVRVSVRRVGITLLLLAFAGGCAPPTDKDPAAAARPSTDAVTEPPAEQAAASVPDAPATESISHAYPTGRLRDVATPTRYAITLTILPEKARFSGQVAIDVTLNQPAEHLFLHGDGLTVHASTLRTQNGELLDVDYTQVGKEGVARVDFPDLLAAQDLTLTFDYDAPFDQRLNGLYRVDEDGRSYAFTQFQSTFARKAFVSFDEPAHRTPFDVRLRVYDDHTAIANTEVVSQEATADGLTEWTFATSEPLPTYLVAFAVGELDVVQGPDIAPNDVRERPVPLRGVAVHGKGGQLDYALRTTGDILTALEAYFDLPYPFSKLDIIAVPDFQAGAMENAGAITFRERLLLLDQNAPVTQRQAYSSVMAHELAHMWFGDLVTMPWWDDIWLNESFATWMSYKAVAAVDPGARPQLRRLSRLRRAKQEDALLSARQIREPVLDHDGIDAAFDGITYAKGGAVLTMFEHFLGADRFREGVRAHMKRFAWGSADVYDFIESLVAVSEPRIASGFESFLFQTGLPNVTVTDDCADGTVSIAQSRYIPLGSNAMSGQIWEFPVCLKYGHEGKVLEQCVWLDEPVKRIELASGACPQWLMPDAGFAGYYNWSMGAAGYAALHSQGAILTEVEWQSVADSITSGLAAGTIDVATAWAASAPLAQAKWPSVAIAPTRLLEYLFEHYSDEPKIAARLREISAQLYASRRPARALEARYLKSLPRDEDRVFFAELFDFAAMVAATPATRTAAYERVSEALTEEGIDSRRLAPVTLRSALSVAVQEGDAQVREKILQAFLASRDSQFRRNALQALAVARDPEFAERMRALTLTKKLRSSEIDTLLRAQFKDRHTRAGAWRWLHANWAQLAPLMPARNAARMPSMTAVFCDEAMAQRVRELFAASSQEYPGGQRALNKAYEAIGNCARRVATERTLARAAFAPGVVR